MFKIVVEKTTFECTLWNSAVTPELAHLEG